MIIKTSASSLFDEKKTSHGSCITRNHVVIYEHCIKVQKHRMEGHVAIIRVEAFKITKMSMIN